MKATRHFFFICHVWVATLKVLRWALGSTPIVLYFFGADKEVSVWESKATNLAFEWSNLWQPLSIPWKWSWSTQKVSFIYGAYGPIMFALWVYIGFGASWRVGPLCENHCLNSNLISAYVWKNTWYHVRKDTFWVLW